MWVPDRFVYQDNLSQRGMESCAHHSHESTVPIFLAVRDDVHRNELLEVP